MGKANVFLLPTERRVGDAHLIAVLLADLVWGVAQGVVPADTGHLHAGQEHVHRAKQER